MEYLENCTFDEIQVGDSATLTRTLTEHDIMLFAARHRPECSRMASAMLVQIVARAEAA